VNDAGVELFSTADSAAEATNVARQPGRYISVAWVPAKFLAEGCHYVRVTMRSMRRQYRPFVESDVISFTVVNENEHVVGASWWEGRVSGVIRPELSWTTEYVPQPMVIEG